MVSEQFPKRYQPLFLIEHIAAAPQYDLAVLVEIELVRLLLQNGTDGLEVDVDSIRLEFDRPLVAAGSPVISVIEESEIVVVAAKEDPVWRALEEALEVGEPGGRVLDRRRRADAEALASVLPGCRVGASPKRQNSCGEGHRRLQSTQ